MMTTAVRIAGAGRYATSMLSGSQTGIRPSLPVLPLPYGRGSVWIGALGLLIAVAPMGCSQPAVDMYDAQDVTAVAATPARYDDTGWANTLRENAKAGLVDYRHLATHIEPLNQYLAVVRNVGPASTPDLFREPNAALAYYINVYNACVLSAVIRAGTPVTMYDPQLPRLESGYRFLVDGKPHTLAELHALASRAARDARVEFALCGAALGTAPLASEPYRAFDVRDRLRRLGVEAMNNPRIVRVDHQQQRLLVGLPIWTSRDAFEATYRRETASEAGTMLNCLMHLAGGSRRDYLVRATGYDQRVLPFDRALNAWKPRSAG